MPRCFYYAVRLPTGIPQILVSTVRTPTALDHENTQLLPEKRGIWDTHQPHLEWFSSAGQVTQAAIALLGHATTAPIITCRYAQRFQMEFLAMFPQEGWTCRADEIRLWVAQQRRHDRWMQALTCVSA